MISEHLCNKSVHLPNILNKGGVNSKLSLATATAHQLSCGGALIISKADQYRDGHALLLIGVFNSQTCRVRQKRIHTPYMTA